MPVKARLWWSNCSVVWGSFASLVASTTGDGDFTLIALIESPQVCSPKFLTCEQRSV